MPYGDRLCMVEDRWRNTWQIACYGDASREAGYRPRCRVRSEVRRALAARLDRRPARAPGRLLFRRRLLLRSQPVAGRARPRRAARLLPQIARAQPAVGVDAPRLAAAGRRLPQRVARL